MPADLNYTEQTVLGLPNSKVLKSLMLLAFDIVLDVRNIYRWVTFLANEGAWNSDLVAAFFLEDLVHDGVLEVDLKEFTVLEGTLHENTWLYMWCIWKKYDANSIRFESFLHHQIQFVHKFGKFNRGLLIDATSDLVGTRHQGLKLCRHKTTDLVAQLALDQIRLNRQFVYQLDHELFQTES